MKKIFKKLFLIGLFSFLFFINNVSADTNVSYQLIYSSDLIDKISYYQNKLNNLHSYMQNINNFCNNGSCYSLSSGQYFLWFEDISSTDWIVGISPVDSGMYAYTSYNSNDKWYNEYKIRYNFKSFKFIFNSDDTVQSYNSYSYGGTSIDNYNFVANVGSPTIIELSTYYDTYFLNDTFSFQLRDTTNSSPSINVPFVVGNSSYIAPRNVIAKEFFDNLLPTEPLNCSKNQVLGFLSNVSDFTFRIKGKSNALSEPIRGQLQFNYPNDITITNSDLNIDIVQFNDNEVAGNYKLNCPDDIKACYIEYSYNYIDDITSEVDFGIKVTFNTNNLPRYIQLYNCFHNDTYDYYNSSYIYTNSSDSSSNNDSIISNFLQDGSQPDLDGLVDTSLIGDGPVDSILLLPLNIMNTLLNVLNTNTCRPLFLPLPFVNRNLTLPCISTIYSQINGLDTFLNWFSAIMSAFILYEYFIRLYKWVDDTLTFRENNHFGGF